MMKKTLNCRGRLLDFSTPKVMGILNITPDSFYNGCKYSTESDIVAHLKQMLDEGAAIIDIGAQSTRPKATLISADDEWKRLEAILKLVRKEFPDAVFSVDTFYAEVAKKAVDSGADMINDISGGTMFYPPPPKGGAPEVPFRGFRGDMFSTIAELKVPYILMHIQGTPQTMQQQPHYGDVVKQVMDYFVERIEQLVSLGAHDIIIDPGFGFGKNTEHNYPLLSHLDLFKFFERPIIVGLSRKSMINKILGTKPEDALNGTTVLNTIALIKGANILRVHDVKEAVEAVKLVEAANLNQSLK